MALHHLPFSWDMTAAAVRVWANRAEGQRRGRGSEQMHRTKRQIKTVLVTRRKNQRRSDENRGFCGATKHSVTSFAADDRCRTSAAISHLCAAKGKLKMHGARQPRSGARYRLAVNEGRSETRRAVHPRQRKAHPPREELSRSAKASHPVAGSSTREHDLARRLSPS